MAENLLVCFLRRQQRAFIEHAAPSIERSAAFIGRSAAFIERSAPPAAAD